MRFETNFRTGLAAILTISLMGCATTGRPDPATCALIGAGTGAVGGGVGGGLYSANNTDRDHNEWEGAGIALASTAVGAGVGYLVCSLMEEEPKPEPKRATPPPPPPKPAPPPEPARPDPCKERVRLDNVNFDNNKSEIKPAGAAVLDEEVTLLQRCPARRVRLTAHTDSNGSDAYNLKLSQRRADSVRSYLVSHGIDASRVEAAGRGETEPIADNATAEGRAQNRRVELEPIE